MPVDEASFTYDLPLTGRVYAVGELQGYRPRAKVLQGNALVA